MTAQGMLTLDGGTGQAPRAPDPEAVAAILSGLIRRYERAVSEGLTGEAWSVMAEAAPLRGMEQGAAAPNGEPPRWGQPGRFVVEIRGAPSIVSTPGIVGPHMRDGPVPVVIARPLMPSGLWIAPEREVVFDRLNLAFRHLSGETVEALARRLIERRIRDDLRGSLVPIRA